jgi:chromosomal replication initiation ATPase DnaA
MAIYLIRELTDLSYEATGAIFGRDHATAIASYTKIDTNVKTMIKTANDVKTLLKEIKGN